MIKCNKPSKYMAYSPYAANRPLDDSERRDLKKAVALLNSIMTLDKIAEHYNRPGRSKAWLSHAARGNWEASHIVPDLFDLLVLGTFARGEAQRVKATAEEARHLAIAQVKIIEAQNEVAAAWRSISHRRRR